MKASLRFYLKDTIEDRYVMELSMHEIGESVRYPDGIKYGMILKDLLTGDFVLFDNHHPKGPHIHVNDREFGYTYESDEKLLEDFKKVVLQEMGVKL